MIHVKICNKIPPPLRSYSGDLYQKVRILTQWLVYRGTQNFESQNCEYIIYKGLVQYRNNFQIPFRIYWSSQGSHCSNCCAINVTLFGFLAFQRVSPTDHPCSPITDCCAWSFLIYHGNMPQAVVFKIRCYCKASPHLFMWRQPCNISFIICFHYFDWQFKDSSSFIMWEHLIVTDVLNILNFHMRQQPKELSDNQQSSPKLIYEIILICVSAIVYYIWTIQDRPKPLQFHLKR